MAISITFSRGGLPYLLYMRYKAFKFAKPKGISGTDTGAHSGMKTNPEQRLGLNHDRHQTAPYANKSTLA